MPHHESFRRLVVRAVVSSAVLVAAFAPAVGAAELRLTTENDLLVSDRDDLYTYSVALELERGDYTIALRENAFTDRAANVRFDETEVSVGRELPAPGEWTLHAEAGVVHVGEGVFGEQTQNAVHDLLGGEEVELPYAGSSLHGRAALAAERPFALGDRLTVGPHLEIDAVPGLRSYAVLAAQAEWRPATSVTLEALAGARFTHASHPALEPHLESAAPVARVGVVLHERIALTWSYNDHGDGRDHLGVAYRVPTGVRIGR